MPMFRLIGGSAGPTRDPIRRVQPHLVLNGVMPSGGVMKKDVDICKRRRSAREKARSR